MKKLTIYDLKPEDRLGFAFDGVFDAQAAWDIELKSFFQVLEEYAGAWMPALVEGKRQRPYARAAIWKALEEGRHGRGTNIGFYRTTWPALDMMFGLSFPPLPPRLDAAIDIKPLSFFAEEQRCHRFVDMVRAWASRYPTLHAVAHSSDDMELADFPNFGRDDQARRRDGFDKIYELCWLNVFGPKLVQAVGRERMLSTPAHRLEELPDGSVLLVLWPTVADFSSLAAREAQARAHVHLRPELNHDTVLRTLLERSAMLAPVQPRFPPDLEPLLSQLVDQVASHKRQRQIAEFNAWHPPEPEEWLPATAPLPTDVPEVKRACEHLDDLAEHLVALLHTEVPSVMKATPESLTDVDSYFWREDFPGRRSRQAIDERAVPAIGAYLGEVLVRHLGGEWLPRRKLEESQVLVGSRLWLPFVRARHYMRSRQSLLDFSLTHLYRVAGRHRSRTGAA